MDRRLIYVFAARLAFEGEMMRSATKQLRTEIERTKEEFTHEGGFSMQIAARSMVSTAGTVSHILYGIRDDRQSRRARRPLRDALGITDTQRDLLKNRSVRDSVEHVDERLEAWVKRLPDETSPEEKLARLMSHMRAGYAYGDPRNSFGDCRIEGEDNSAVFVIGGNANGTRGQERLQLFEVSDAVTEVSTLAVQWLNDNPHATPGRFPFLDPHVFESITQETS